MGDSIPCQLHGLLTIAFMYVYLLEYVNIRCMFAGRLTSTLDDNFCICCVTDNGSRVFVALSTAAIGSTRGAHCHPE